MKFFHGSIRKKLVILVLLATMPVFLVLLFTALQNRHDSVKHAERDTTLYLNGFVEIQRRITNSTQTLLSTVASIPDISMLDAEKSRIVLETLLETNPIYTNAILVDLEGNVIAAGKNNASAQKINFRDRKQFKEAIAFKGFSSGEFVIGKSSQKAIFPFGMAVLNNQGDVIGAIIIGINLVHYGELFERGNYPTSTFFGICDHNGTRLFRYPINDSIDIGKPIQKKVFNSVASSGQKGSVVALASDGKKRVVVYEPLRLMDNSKTPYIYMFMGFDYEQLQEKANSTLIRLLVTSLLSLALALFIAWFVGGRNVARLIDKLSIVTRKFSQGEKDVTSNIDYSDGEIGGLAQSFDSMTDIIRQREGEKNQLEIQLHQIYKMEAIGTLAGGIAHDFNNILSIIIGYTDMAKEDAPPGTDSEKYLENVSIAANRAKDLVKQILAFSRQGKAERLPIKLQPLVKEGLKMLRSSIPTTISITDEIDPKSRAVLADPTQVHQILMNLCTNAYHAMENTGGTLSVSLKTTIIKENDQKMVFHLAPGEYVEVIVSDSGEGIGPDVIDKIFDPYFTTKEIGKGTGMGLAIIHGIMKEYGGAIIVESMLGQGATFHIYFPAVKDDAVPKVKEEENLLRGNERVLFVDDEQLLAEMSKDMLERLGYQVTVRRSSIEALTTFQNTPNDFDLVITDQTMPDMTGSDLARRMLQVRPDVPIILCTGYSNTIDEHSAKALGIKEFALKPLTKESASKLIRKVLDEEK